MSAYCSDIPQLAKIPRLNASTGPEWDSVQIKTSMDQDGPVTVLNVTWKLQVDGE